MRDGGHVTLDLAPDGREVWVLTCDEHGELGRWVVAPLEGPESPPERAWRLHVAELHPPDDCPCCGRYGRCSWFPYYRQDDPERDPYYDLEAMPATTMRGLADGYDDGMIDAVIEELLRLRSLAAAHRLAPQPDPDPPWPARGGAA